jgi:hypothetical protein
MFITPSVPLDLCAHLKKCLQSCLVPFVYAVQIRNLIDHSWMATTGGAWDENKAAEVAVQLRKAIATAGRQAGREHAAVCSVMD